MENYFSKVYELELATESLLKKDISQLKDELQHVNAVVRDTATKFSGSLPDSVSAGPSLKFKLLTFLASTTFAVAVWLLQFFMVLLLFIILLKNRGLLDCYGCGNAEAFDLQTNAFFVGLCYLIFFAVIIYLVKKEPDPLQIKRELILAVIVLLPFALIWVILIVTDPNNLEKDSKLSWGFFIYIATLGAYTAVIPWQIHIAKQQKAAIDQESADETDYVTQFNDIFKNPSLEKLFKAHLMDESSFENFLFWKYAEKWKLNYQKLKSRPNENLLIANEGFTEVYMQNMKADIYRQAVKMFRLFMDRNSLLEINISGEVREAARRKLTTPNVVTMDIFDEALEEVLRLMQFDTFYRFKQSKKYLKWRKGQLEEEDLPITGEEHEL